MKRASKNLLKGILGVQDKSKLCKIKYRVNLLPQVGFNVALDKYGEYELVNKDLSLSDLCD